MASKPKRQRTAEIKKGPQPGKASLKNNPKNYAKSYQRISKDNLYMVIALWMEDFVDEVPEHCRNVGAVLVLPNDMVLGADCSRDRVHAVARLLTKHNDKAEGCKIFVSRKPCPMCAKLLVQSKVKRVLYLPFEPEYYRSPEPPQPNADKKARKESKKINDQINESNDTKMKQVDNLFTASAIAQTIFVFEVEKSVLEHAEQKTPTKDKNRKKQIGEEKCRLIKKYGFDKNPDWMESIKEKLPWSAFDTEIKAQTQVYFNNAMAWMARVQVLLGRGLNYEFELCSDDSKSSSGFNPVSNHIHKKQAHHFMAIARFLAERTDDPKTGVGAVVVNPNMEILAFGWNGFPVDAQYGEFARGSKDDPSADKKYPYVIHAEQNAVLMRNSKNFEGAILFVTKSPCNECTPLIAMQGIETVVVDDDVLSRKETTQKNALVYKMFPEDVKKGKFICYQTRELSTIPRNVRKRKI